MNQFDRLKEAQNFAKEALAINNTFDEATAKIWTTYNILAKIYDKQDANTLAKKYRKLSRDSYLRFEGMVYELLDEDVDNIYIIVSAVLSQNNNILSRLCSLFNRSFVSKRISEIQDDLNKAPAHKEKLANAIRYILGGQRNEEILLEPLDYSDAAIVHLILKGIENIVNLKKLRIAKITRV